MAVRTTMANLILQVRDLLADPAGASQTFTDQQIQDALDLRREDVRTYPLRGEPTFSAGGPLSYLDYYADCVVWEDGATLLGSGYQASRRTPRSRCAGTGPSPRTRRRPSG
jgi:hypothetical protein